jgi:hypothetical protein
VVVRIQAIERQRKLRLFAFLYPLDPLLFNLVTPIIKQFGPAWHQISKQYFNAAIVAPVQVAAVFVSALRESNGTAAAIHIGHFMRL